MTRDAVICEPLRTPVGRFGGVFREVPAARLASTIVAALWRVAALDAGLPVDVPGLQIDRRCGSGLQAVIEASMMVQTGAAELLLAGGAESMSQAELYSTALRWGSRSGGAMLEDRLVRSRVTAGGINHPVPGGMLETAENLRREYGITRPTGYLWLRRFREAGVAGRMNGHPANQNSCQPFDTHPSDDGQFWLATRSTKHVFLSNALDTKIISGLARLEF